MDENTDVFDVQITTIEEHRRLEETRCQCRCAIICTALIMMGFTYGFHLAMTYCIESARSRQAQAGWVQKREWQWGGVVLEPRGK